MLKLYEIFLNGDREASLLESDLLNKGALKTDLTVFLSDFRIVTTARYLLCFCQILKLLRQPVICCVSYHAVGSVLKI
jgi:hypothetical protein